MCGEARKMHKENKSKARGKCSAALECTVEEGGLATKTCHVIMIKDSRALYLGLHNVGRVP